jgi:iron complex outermembrane receptor protein
MKSGDIKMLLNENTQIATQQTSAVSATTNSRIQGFHGHYSQMLKAGTTLYSGFRGGLSVMQIAPLDPKQVEFIKVSISALYGAGAIARLINLISKTPRDTRELTALLNITSAKGFDISSFYSQKLGKIGTALFTSYSHNDAYDSANIELTAIQNYFSLQTEIQEAALE